MIDKEDSLQIALVYFLMLVALILVGSVLGIIKYAWPETWDYLGALPAVAWRYVFGDWL